MAKRLGVMVQHLQHHHVSLNRDSAAAATEELGHIYEQVAELQSTLQELVLSKDRVQQEQRTPLIVRKLQVVVRKKLAPLLLQRPIEYGALLLALLATPEVANITEMSQELDSIATQCLKTAKGAHPFALMEAINRTLFSSLGFCGNKTNYYDPRNSNLHNVLFRKTGIPITLAVVWAAVAERLGLHATGCSFPSHFLVRINLPVVDSILAAMTTRSDPPFDDQAIQQLNHQLGWDPTGLWCADYGQGMEVVQFAVFKSTDGTDHLQAVKVFGDENVPGGEVSWRVKLEEISLLEPDVVPSTDREGRDGAAKYWADALVDEDGALAEVEDFEDGAEDGAEDGSLEYSVLQCRGQLQLAQPGFHGAHFVPCTVSLRSGGGELAEQWEEEHTRGRSHWRPVIEVSITVPPPPPPPPTGSGAAGSAGGIPQRIPPPSVLRFQYIGSSSHFSVASSAGGGAPSTARPSADITADINRKADGEGESSAWFVDAFHGGR
jgi:hypothetical protein